ncbi:MAG: hypothetical protein E6G89_07275 [Alphaproteobacteria bacterium]|nr:MAG: hypothetical protein E6G89_07275 [Alphaproteobacteria bacterium]
MLLVIHHDRTRRLLPICRQYDCAIGAGDGGCAGGCGTLSTRLRGAPSGGGLLMKKHSLKSGSVLLTANLAEMAFPFIRNVLLSRLLSQENFGVAVSLAMISAMIEIGFDFGIPVSAVRYTARDDPKNRAPCSPGHSSWLWRRCLQSSSNRHTRPGPMSPSALARSCAASAILASSRRCATLSIGPIHSPSFSLSLPGR